MTAPSTADSKDAGQSVRAVAEPGAVADSGTHAVVKGQAASRLPHEHDESSDSGKREPTEHMRKAADDARRGQSDPPRGPATQQHYSELTARASPPAAPTTAAPTTPPSKPSK